MKAAKIINLDAFKKKESGIKPPGRQQQPANLFDRLDRELLYVGALVVAAALALAMIMTPSRKASVTVPPVGSVAEYNIKAPEEMLVEDRESTAKNRRLAAESAPDIYDFDSKAETNLLARIKDAQEPLVNEYLTQSRPAYLDVIAALEYKDESGHRIPSAAIPKDGVVPEKRLAESRRALTKVERSEGFQRLAQEFETRLNITLDAREREVLRQYHYWPRIWDMVGASLAPVYAKGVAERKGETAASANRGMILRNIASGAERASKDLAELYDMPEARKKIRDEAASRMPERRPALRKLVASLSQKLLQANVTFNRKETELRRELASSDAKPVFFRVQRGEMIVREGELVTQAQAERLSQIAGSLESRGRFTVFMGLFLINLLLMSMAAFFLRKFHDEIVEYPKLQGMLAALIVTHMGLVWASMQVFTVFLTQTPRIDLPTYMLAAPMAFGPMIVSIFFTAELTVLFSVVAAALTVLMAGDLPALPLLTITAGLVCAHHVRAYNRRSSVIKVGLSVSMVNLIITLAFGMTGPNFFSEDQFFNVISALAGGCVAALLVSGALPVLESLFPVVSDIKLLELSNLNHPLLRRMILEAPGTYHHSMMVGNLAEEACKSIGANALLARAGALFHDIGKMKMPEYFVENQASMANPHDKLTPHMSARILINHIKEGVEMARQSKLLPQITAMIPEHHGTQLARYFYAKAKEAEEAARAQVMEVDFQYPGPIPSSKESACVALADSIEASARACSEPTPGKLKTIVTDVINDKFVQGQLDNSHLTLKDLAHIAHSFTHVLTAIHHHRIQYPDQGGDKERRHGSGSGIKAQDRQGARNQ
ncbi:MAG: HDIG domain-containing protein [Nitrospinae bacterium]|nr:HDIG domain-containing protein [Nitrospinota bacterium]